MIKYIYGILKLKLLLAINFNRSRSLDIVIKSLISNYLSGKFWKIALDKYRIIIW
jgi:hypothetical protein